MEKLLPLILCGLSLTAAASVGGKVAPDNKTEIHVDLPNNLHRQNVSSRGQGCCTHTSVHHAALWANVKVLQEFPKWVQDKGLPGGTYPKMMDDRIAMICKEKGVPIPEYVALEGGKETLDILKAALKSGRMVSCTYSFSPTGRYGGGKISHMVNLVHLDEKYAVILDNNYIGDTKYEWLSIDEFLRTYTGGRAGWAIVLLDPGPPSLPHN
jgi:hypothetical protein